MQKAAEVLRVLALLVLLSCGGNRKRPEAGQGNFEKPLPTGNTAHLTGQQLAQGYCGSCHLFPAPALLDKQTWKNSVLPNMAMRLGLALNSDNPYVGIPYQDIQVVVQAGVFADKPLISQQDWEKIVTYYDSAAPETPLPQEMVPPVNVYLPLFTSKPHRLKNQKAPLTTLAKFDETQARLFLGDKGNNLLILDKNFNRLDSLLLDSPASDVHVYPDGSFDLLTIGVLEPSDRSAGKLTRYTRNSAGAYTAQILIESLNRPVEATYADLDMDGLTDIIICNYGNHTGRLAWFRNQGNGRYKENILKNIPGSRHVVVQDFDGDHRPDIMALVAQASESITLFYNQGRGSFEEKQVLRFPPVYGSSYFEVADFNGDGKPDILYTNGDNADYSISLKRYHGLRLFLNDGADNFKQAWFYPLHGASKAIVRDFDGDGDLDIAAISFFPDYQKQPQQGFVFFKNSGNMEFQASTFPGAASGHWLTLESADVDQDSDQDLLLGSFVAMPVKVPPVLQARWINSGPNILVLENNRTATRRSSVAKTK
ncbi:MAG: hypothetical protein JWQ14_2429 [Adhaeribacter sp.]|nr:hypothetical protein [Adhaeribacter sp.]